MSVIWVLLAILASCHAGNRQMRMPIPSIPSAECNGNNKKEGEINPRLRTQLELYGDGIRGGEDSCTLWTYNTTCWDFSFGSTGAGRAEELCKNDKLEKLWISAAPKGAKITLFDNNKGSLDDDYTVITVLEDITPAGHIVQSGYNCNRITTPDGCQYMARKMGLMDTAAYNGYGEGTWCYEPPNCVMEGCGPNGCSTVYFNECTTSNVACSSSDRCICSTRAGIWINEIDCERSCMWTETQQGSNSKVHIDYTRKNGRLRRKVSRVTIDLSEATVDSSGKK